MSDGIRIVQLTAANVKKLVAVDITPEGDVVIIGGDNAQGKTSVLDSIWLALGGASALKGQTKPVREGAPGASVRLDLGRLIVTRTWTADGRTTLKVANAEGMQFNSPQKVLDELVGNLTFDPLSFANAPAKEQRAQLLSLVELPFDPDELEVERKRIFDERTEANRQVRFYQANYDGMPGDEFAPPTEIDVETAMRVFEQAERKNNAWMQAEQEKERILQSIRAETTNIESLERQLADSKVRQTALVNSFEDLCSATEQLEEIDMEPFRAGILAANEAVNHDKDNANKVAARESLEGQKEIAAHLSNLLEQIERRKREGLASASMPVEGLSFDEDGVLFNDVPFSQASGAERLRVSMAIAAATNPRVRIMRITDGSLLDRKNMDLVTAFAAENDYQVWLERVGDQDESAIIIEEGEIRA